MKKKLLAGLTASSMLLSMLTAGGSISAATSDSGTTATPGSNYKITRVGDVRYVSNRIFNVTFPTAQGFDFVIDPQGLYGKVGIGNKLSELSENAGKIIFEESPTILNESGVPVTVTASIQVTGGATHLSTANFTTANSPQTAGAMAKGTTVSTLTKFDENDLLDGDDILNLLTNGGTSVANAVCMFMSPSKFSVSDGAATYVSSGLGYVLSPSVSAFKFVIDPADYSYDADKNELSLVPNTGHGTKLQLGGFVNTNADWTNFTLPGIITRPATLNSINLTRLTAHRLAAADVNLSDYTSYALNPMDTSVSNHFSIKSSINLSNLKPVKVVSDPGTVVMGVVNTDEANGAAIGGNVPYVSTNSNYGYGIVRGASIAAANNTATKMQNQVATHRAWGLNETVESWDDVIWLPVAVTDPKNLKETEMVNTIAKTIGISITFKFAESTPAERGYAKKYFGWDTKGLGATTDGIASRKLDNGSFENVAYGLLGSSVNARKIIAVDFNP